MKKIFFVFAVVAMAFTSCNPLEDEFAEIDNQENVVVGDANITLTSDNYTEDTEDGGLGLSNEYFATIDEAKSLVPGFLATKYPVWGKSSSVGVTFNYSNPVEKSVYTVSAADYTAIGLSSLESDQDFETFFNYKYTSAPSKGTIVDLTYKTSPAITDYELTDADYDLVGNGQFDNFDIRTGKADETEEARRVKIQTILLNNFPSANVGDKYRVAYKAFNDSFTTVDLQMEVILTENTPANVTDYTLVNADYALVGNGNFNNFDIRPGRAEETEEARRVKIETILLNNFPAAAAGDIYNVTYAIWNNAPGELEMLLEFDGTNWNIYKALTFEFYTFALIDMTSRFAYVNSWEAPFALGETDYRAMGQQYNNFNGRNDEQKAEAVRLIEIYLGTLYPYAANEDFKAVQYKVYEGGGVTTTLNVNFVYDGAKWNGIPEVVAETIKFGHDGTSWVPDNTIKYTLTNADYALVGNDRYNNFDVRPGKDEEAESARLAKINTILLNNFPSDAEGQKYIVSYNIYNGSNGVWQMAVIKTGGVYVLQ